MSFSGKIAGALLLASSMLAAPALADGLYDNVNGMTLDEDGQLVRFTGILIDKDGKVSKLLDRKDKRPKNLDWREDGDGRTLMPGFIDAHGHVMQLGFQQLTLDLSQTSSLAEAQAAIADYAREYPDRRWILGSGWNQEKWGLGRFPTAAELDAVVPDRPVWLGRVDGHAGWANSVAIAEAGVTAKTEAPDGGRIEMANGEPSGVFVDKATALIEKVVPLPRPAERDLALAEAQKVLLSNGVTGTADMGVTIEDWQSYRRAGDAGWLNMHVAAYAMGVDQMVLIAGQRPTPWLYDDKLKLAGVKLYLDGALGSRGAWLKQPYSDAPDETGLPMLGSAELRNLMSRASMDGFQTAIHAIGDAANAEVIGAVEELSETYKGDRRWRIEHAQIVDPADLPRLAKSGIIASMQPVHQTSDRIMAETRLGPDRLGGAYAWRTILNGGGRLAFGSDFPVEAPDPFAGFAAAISRTGPDGQPFGGWRPQDAVSRNQALAAFTTGAAYAEFSEDQLGSLTPGHRADFIIIDRDIMLASPAEVRETQLLETWVNGLPAYRAKD